jgi:dTDP-4-dehydrorhamnose 3,5-epimerase
VKVVETELPGVLLLEPRVHQDARGFFFESYNRRAFREATGVEVDFVQDNQSFSVRNVLRGLHYQIRQPQGKLVHVLAGEIFDVVVDLRRSSPTFGKWLGTPISGGGHRMIWIPAGFAHGYLALSEHAIVFYKTTDFYAPQHERTVLWNDPELAVRWPLEGAPIVSEKDQRGGAFRSADCFD